MIRFRWELLTELASINLRMFSLGGLIRKGSTNTIKNFTAGISEAIPADHLGEVRDLDDSKPRGQCGESVNVDRERPLYD